ncbi:MAG TPA: carboxypeptidase-like regulatory domain-containing protein [Bryobacteraceae bacterium]|nr:carboxypeptidase-like regulatory domain-containing protein [Bryobacteraceae bacterium]
MNIRSLFFIPVVLLMLAPAAPAQQADANKPLPSIGNNRPKRDKDTNTRIIEGTVQDPSSNLVSEAIVQLKDTKTAKIVDFVTKSDGRFAFRDLPMDIDYELVAKHGGATTPVRKVSVYDTRKDVVVNLQLSAAKATVKR